MPTDTTIRRAKRSDINTIEQLEHVCFVSDRLSRGSLYRALRSDSAELWVLENRGSMAAYALLFYRRNSRRCRLYSLAVDPSIRQQGFAQQLLQALEKAALARACKMLHLEVREDNAAAIALYRKQGYCPFGMIAGFYEDSHTALRLQKNLCG